MREELDKLLCERYPKIFSGRHKPATETAMCWGFACGDGWFDLIDCLCGRLQFWTDHHAAPQVVATQVKEKFGSLRFHARNGNEHQQGMIDMVCAFSEHICEVCGSPGTPSSSDIRKTRCDKHPND